MTDQKHTRGRHGAPTRAGLVVALAFLVAAALPFVGARADGSNSFMQVVGSLDRFAADARAALGAEFVPTNPDTFFGQQHDMGTAIIVPEARELWQIYSHPDIGIKRTGILIRSLDTLRITRTVVLPLRFKRATREAVQGDWAHALDPEGRRVFMLDASQTHVHEIDMRTLQYKSRQILGDLDPQRTNFGNTRMVGGMTYDPAANDVLVLYSGVPTAQSVEVALYRLDVSGAPVPFDITKMYRIRACTAPISSADAGDDTYGWEILVTKEHLYVPCMQLGHTAIVVRMQRPAGGTDLEHVEDVVAGPVYAETVLADQASGRLFVITFPGQEIWVFEASTMSFIGVVATGPQGETTDTGYGLDRATGRVFFQSPEFGLGVVEGRFFPVPQARTLPRFVKGVERILSDAATGRVFVVEGHPLVNQGETGKSRAYTIYKADPAPKPPPPPDPDANTADLPEREGVTEPRWNASGSGYGTRVLWAKGYSTVVPAPTFGLNAPTSVLAEKLRDRCGYTDRDLFAGRVVKAEYDTGTTAASATAMAVDGATKQDLNDLARCVAEFETALKQAADVDAKAGTQTQAPLEDGTTGYWPYGGASCASSQGFLTKEDPTDKDLGESSASCPEPGGKLVAHGETKLSGLPVQVDRSWAHTTIERTPGVRVTVDAVAQGLSIRNDAGAELVWIGEIRSTATSASNGRPKREDMSTHDISISEARVLNRVICQSQCSDKQLADLENTLNIAAGGRARFRVGKGVTSGRDDELVEGSPRGAQTAVQKSTARQASDRALLGDFTVEVPAFEITIFNDNPDNNPTWGPGWGRARQVYQFAAVAAAATYNVVLQPTGFPFPPDGGGVELPDDPDVADTGNTPYGELIEEVGDDGVVLGPTRPAGDDGDADGDGGLLGGISRVLKAVGRGIRLFLTSPRHALLLLTAWALLSSPAVLSRRRRLLAGIRSD